MKKYEYKHANFDFDEQKRGISKEDFLNGLGKEGWELVCLYSEPSLSHISFYLKREIEEPKIGGVTVPPMRAVTNRPFIDDVPTSTEIRNANASRPPKIALTWAPHGGDNAFYFPNGTAHKVFASEWTFEEASAEVEKFEPGKYLFQK